MSKRLENIWAYVVIGTITAGSFVTGMLAVYAVIDSFFKLEIKIGPEYMRTLVIVTELMSGFLCSGLTAWLLIWARRRELKAR